MTKKGKLNNDTVKLFLDPELSHLALSNCESKFSISSFYFIIFYYYLFTYITLINCLGLDSAALNLIPQTCRKLVTLSLNGCGKLSNDTLNLVS